MDYRLMGQMTRGRSFFIENPTLSEFPVGDFRTPGFGGAHRLYTIFEPFYDDTTNDLLTATKKIDKIESEQADKNAKADLEIIQQGFGKISQTEIEDHNEPLKRKLTEDIFYKMQHPIYKTTKVKHARLEVGEPSTPASSSQPSTSFAATSKAVKRPSATATTTSGEGEGRKKIPSKSIKKEKIYCKF
jgi:hypothetical protein